MDAFGIGWRDGVLLLIGLAAVYLVLLLLRLGRVAGAGRARQHSVDVPGSPPAFGSEPMIDLGRELPGDIAAVVAEAARHEESPAARFAAAGGTGWAGAVPARPAPVAEAAPEPEFARELARTGMEAELQVLRRESAELRRVLDEVREELAVLKAARNVSPLYNEAMALAQRGVGADGIASQCGISLAEAELVAALARGDANDEPRNLTEDFHDGYADPRPARHG